MPGEPNPNPAPDVATPPAAEPNSPATPPAAAPAATPEPGTPTPPAPSAPSEAEAAAQAARDLVPDAADKYVINAADKLKPYLGGADDPAMSELRAFAHETGKSQGWVDDQMALLQRMADKGMLGETFDPAAEVAALGTNGVARQQEQEVFLTALKEKGDLDDAEYAEAASLLVTAAGVKLLEKLRARMTGTSGVVNDGAPSEAGDLKAKARQQREDPRYNTDKAFRKETDDLFIRAHSTS